MKLKPQRASISQARRFIIAKGWRIDGKEVVIPAQAEGGEKQRIPLKRFCQEYAGVILGFDEFRKDRHKRAVKVKLTRQKQAA